MGTYRGCFAQARQSIRPTTGSFPWTSRRLCAILSDSFAKWHIVKKPKPHRRGSKSPATRRPAHSSGASPESDPRFPGFRSPAAVYDSGEALLTKARAPAVRATPNALRALETHGYSEDEIFALVVPRRTFARRLKRHEPLTVEETDRAIRLARVAELAERIFGDKEKAHRWLRKPKLALDRATPLTYLASEGGARVVEDMLWRIDYGILA
jgi:putative toxin-antitoxin system antitoxin component (TIGR02293 family)